MEKALRDSLGLKKYIKIFDKFKLRLGRHSTELWIPDLSQGLGKPVWLLHGREKNPSSGLGRSKLFNSSLNLYKSKNFPEVIIHSELVRCFS